MAAQTWEVRVRGPIPSDVLAELGAAGLTEEPAQTIMRTEPPAPPAAALRPGT